MAISFSLNSMFSLWSCRTAKLVGKPASFIVALVLVIIWALSGPMFHFNEGWQLVINTGTTIITFLMVFLIQNAQNRDSEAIQIKLDELLHAIDAASNKIINIESLDDDAMELLREQYKKGQRNGNKEKDPSNRGKSDS